MEEANKFPVRDPEVLLALITKNFPEVSWNSYKYIDEGWDHEVIILDNKLVFRFPNDDEYLEHLQNELKVLPRLLSLVKARIPDYKFVAPDSTCAGYELVPGETITKEYFDSLSAEERASLASQLAEFMSTMHTLIKKGHDFSSVVPSDMTEHQEQLREQAVKYLKGTLTGQEYAAAEEIIKDTDTVLARGHPIVFLHGDMYQRHLLWDQNSKQLGIIDFSDMNRGDPAFDFAELYEYGKDFVQEIYDQYTGPKYAGFLERAWTYQRWVGVFMMVDHFLWGKTSFTEAREIFDRVKTNRPY